MRRPAAALCAGLLLALAACAAPTEGGPAGEAPASPGGPAPAATPADTPSAGGAAAAMPPTASDLRISATMLATTGSCRPQDVTVALTPVEPALGHRYARVALRNVSGSACTVEGYPGIGARGESGDALELAAEQRQRTGEPAHVRRVTVAPEAEAYANLEWTGALAGAESEHLTVLALQLARGQAPVAVSADEPLDIGNGTTVRIGPWEPGPALRAQPDAGLRARQGSSASGRRTAAATPRGGSPEHTGA